MKRNLPFFVLLCFFLPVLSSAQSNVKDSALMIPMIHANYSYGWPGGDLKDRFGGNSTIGGGFDLKLRNNWIFGAHYDYIFGGKVKNGDSLFSAIDTEDGFLIDRNGELNTALLFERGYHVSVRFGKLFPIWSPNPNSGPFVTAGIGYLQHKIRIENSGNTIPQVIGDYKKGYDKLSSGLAISEFVGYMYFGNKRLISFYGGIEFTQAFTRSRRSYDFNLERYDDTKRLDLMYAIKVGWIIPFYKRKPVGYYYD